MGNATRRLRQFLTQHPNCCYCGGSVVATTQDHFPPRGIFRGRQWPEGYVFPACARCNNSTSDDEQLMGMLCRIYPGSASDDEERELTLQMRAIAERQPDVFRSMQPSAVRVKRWLRDRGIELLPGQTTADVPIVSLDHERFGDAAEGFARKLFCSLYYKHTGIILPSEGRIVFKWVTNAQGMDALQTPEPFRPLLSGIPTLKRQSTSLHDQFTYRFAVTDDRKAAAFYVLFRKSLAMIGVVLADATGAMTPERAKLLRPLPPSH